MSHFIFGWMGIAFFVLFAFTGLLLWRPGYYAWGLLTGGLLLLWTLFLLDDIARGVNWVRGNSVYWLIFGCCVILGGHLLADQYLPQVKPSNLSGNINISMFFHLMLIAIAILLAQRIGDIPSLGKIFPDVLSLLMMLVCGISAAAVPNGPGRNSLWLISASGICIWMIPFVRVLFAKTIIQINVSDLEPTKKVKLLLRIFVACCVAILLLLIINPFCLFVLAGCAVFVVLFYITAKLDKPFVCWALIGIGGVGIFIIARASGLPDSGLLGMGEKGFSDVYGGSSGLAILTATTGWAGVGIVVLGSLAIAARGIQRASKISSEQLASAGLWILATFIASAAFLAPGGYVSLASVVALAVTWGLWPRMVDGQAGKFRSGWILFLAMLAMLGLLTLVQRTGFLLGMGQKCGLQDKGEHLVAGFVFTMVTIWLLGGRRWWLGVIGFVLAALTGGLAELAQKFFTSGRSVEMDDWKAHAIGSGIAGFIFALALLYRLAIKHANSGRKQSHKGWIYTAWILRIILLTILLIFAGWLGVSVCKALNHRWQAPKPDILVSDLLLTPTAKSPYFPGRTNCPEAATTECLLTAQPSKNEVEIGFYAQRPGELLKIFPKLSNIQLGTTQPYYQGQPFSTLGYVQKRGYVFCIPNEAQVLVVEAKDAAGWLAENPAELKQILDDASANQNAVFVHTTSVADFETNREKLRKAYPTIPNVCYLAMKPSPGGAAWFLKKLLQRPDYPVQKILVITSDIAAAKSIRQNFGKQCHANIVGGKAIQAPPKNSWVHYYPDLKTLVDHQKDE